MNISLPTFDVRAVAPELVVLATALLVMAVDLALPRAHKARLAWLGLAGVAAAAVLAFITWDGSNPVLHDMLAADGYALFLHLTILVAAAVAILYSVEYVERSGLAQGEYYTLLLLATAGMMLVAAAVNLMTLFLGLEILSIALYVLVGLNRAERRSGEAALKYFVLGALASGFLVYGMALVFGQAGTTSLAGIRAHVAGLGGPVPALLAVGLGFMVVGLGFKAALVPFHMWSPDVYQGAPTSVTAFMSVGAKLAAFAALGRLALAAFGPAPASWQPVLAVLAALTMSVGNLAALRQTNLVRLLAYSGVAQAGTILVGLAAGTEPGASAMLFYLAVYAASNLAAFGVVIAAGRLARPGPGDTLESISGLARRNPWLAAAMALAMLSLAGLPPLAGFWGKLYAFSAAVQAGMAWLAIVAVINSVVAAVYYLRVVVAMAMSPAAQAEAAPARQAVCPALAAGAGLAAAAVVLAGVWPAPLLNLARIAVAALLGG